MSGERSGQPLGIWPTRQDLERSDGGDDELAERAHVMHQPQWQLIRGLHRQTRRVVRAAVRLGVHTLVLACALVLLVQPTLALKPIPLDADLDRLEITALGQLYEGRGDSFQVEVAGAEGLQARMVVRASSPGASPRWIVFALSNPTGRPIERLLTSERYSLVGSGVVWPDLDGRRIEAVTPSLGFLPERLKNDRADIFRITLEPGQTITYAVELATDRVPRLYLWKPLPYEIKARDRQLFNGIMLGIVGVLGIFLTSVFAANHKGIFPAAALVAWCLLAYLCVDFGFFHKLFNLRVEDNAVYRAATESAVAASIVIFLTTFLRAHAWPGFVRMLAILWIIGQLSLVAVAVVDPRLAATFARASFLVIGVLGSVMILFFFVRGQDRALALIPTWILFLVFIYGGHITLAGRLGGEIVVSSFVASLVLLAVLIGFTVTQFAFRPGDGGSDTPALDSGMSALAIDLARAAIWEWRARSDEIKLGPAVEARLGLMIGELSGKVDQFVKHMHAADRDKFMMQLWSAQERGRAVLNFDVRMRHADNSYVWFNLEASSIAGDEARDLRCVGLMRDVNEHRRAQERLVHDAVHDTRTGLPNRALLSDRIAVALVERGQQAGSLVVVLVLGIDKFTEHNARFGRTVGDTLLQTAAKRIQRHLTAQDTLARVGGDQFGMLIRSERSPNEIALLAERIRTSIQAPTSVVGEDVVLTGSLGIAIADGATSDARELIDHAEIAMQRAKRDGANRFEIYSQETTLDHGARMPTADELRIGIDKGQIKLVYQPIIYLPTEELVGFETLVRWEHPKFGTLVIEDFIALAEANDLTHRLGAHVIDRATEESTRWHTELPRADKPLFVSINVSSQHLFRQGIIADVKRAIQRHGFEPGQLRLEIPETLVMQNPEQADEILAHLKAAGCGLAMDDFGTGYSSLAYLQRFPFDLIKINEALVQKSGSDAASAAIVRSIVALSHELGRKVSADGIEDEVEAALLRSIGCDFAQGFHFGEAVPAKETIAYLRFVRKTEKRLQKRGLGTVKGSSRIIEEATSTKTLGRVLERARKKTASKSVDAKPKPAAPSKPAAGTPSPSQRTDVARAAGSTAALISTSPHSSPPPYAPAPFVPAPQAPTPELAPWAEQTPSRYAFAAQSPERDYDHGAPMPPHLPPMFAPSGHPSGPPLGQAEQRTQPYADEAPPMIQTPQYPSPETHVLSSMASALGAAPAAEQPAPPPPLQFLSALPGILPFDQLPPLTSMPASATQSHKGVHASHPPIVEDIGYVRPVIRPLQTQLRAVPTRPRANLSKLPPRIAQSLARLAGELEAGAASDGETAGDRREPGPPRAAE